MTSASKDLTERIRTLLERLVQSRRLSNDDREVIGDEIVAEARELPREFILDALDKAIGRNKRRREEAVYLLSEWTDVPAVVDRIGEWINDPDPQWRNWLIQTVAQDGLTKFSPHLKDIIEHDPDECGDTFFNPGESIRAAQAVCDIRGWEFEWHALTVEKTKNRVLIARNGA
jgi:hypothetical protein